MRHPSRLCVSHSVGCRRGYIFTTSLADEGNSLFIMVLNSIPRLGAHFKQVSLTTDDYDVNIYLLSLSPCWSSNKWQGDRTHILSPWGLLDEPAPRIHINQSGFFWICFTRPSHFFFPSNTLADLSMSATLVNRDEKEIEGEEIKVWGVWQREDGGWDRWHEVCSTLAWLAWC